jgi:Excalibur calcium-binding domain
MALAHLNRALAGLVLLSVIHVTQGASPVHKCVINGNVTFQSSPCPADKPVPRPTLDELNAERKKRLAAAATTAASVPTASPSPSPVGTRSTAQPPIQAAPEAEYRCDGRQHCSQMRSCREAKYFLANCPGVKMDGDRDGVPCEEQWCTSPFSK